MRKSWAEIQAKMAIYLIATHLVVLKHPELEPELKDSIEMTKKLIREIEGSTTLGREF